MTSEEMIAKRDIAIYVDVICCGCGGTVALSYTVRQDGHYYCPTCA